MALPLNGRLTSEVEAHLQSRRAHDVRWKDGRALTLAYSAGVEVDALAARVLASFGSDNALNTDAFPSLRELQAEVVDGVLGWLGGDGGTAGFMSTGGTESVLMAVLAARQRGRRERGVETPNMVLPASAHAAFEKAAHYFGVESRRVPVDASWRADPDAMKAVSDDQTVLLVASAPQYPHGVIDPIEDIASAALEHGCSCHVDACMGGITLTYMSRLGEPVPPWNFDVPGVSSISVDLHKYGYTAKGASVIAYRTKALRADQTFVTDNWLGGLYGSSGILGTKSGGPLAAAWAVMQHLGEDGYLRLTATARRCALELADGVEAIDGLQLRARPEATLLAFGATDPSELDVFAVADALWARGWYVDKQGPPPSLHCTVNPVHDGHIGEFIRELAACVASVRAEQAHGVTGAYGTVE